MPVIEKDAIVPSRTRSVMEHLPIDALKPDPENPREHSRQQISQIAASIGEFGFGPPIMVANDLKILAGHGRWLAAKKLKLTDVPVVRMAHLTPVQARAYSIADNKLTETSRFNKRQLAAHFEALLKIDLPFGIELTGFCTPEIDMTIKDVRLDSDPPAMGDDEPVPAPASGPAVAKLGQVFVLGRHRLICGDSRDVDVYQRLLQGRLVDAVFNDPGYNCRIHGHVSGKGKRRHREFAMAVGEMPAPQYGAFLTQICRLASDHSREGSVHFWCMDWRNIDNLLAAGRGVYGELLNICVWVKNNGGMGSLYRSAHEMVAVFRKGSASHTNNVQLGRFGRDRRNVWEYQGANTFIRNAEDGDLLGAHPTPKPVALVADALLDVTARGDLVLDAFLGSAGTLMACERTGRVCRGIELDPLYVDLAIRRWQRHTGETAILEETGETFDALAAAKPARARQAVL